MIDEVCAHLHNYFETDPVTGDRMIYPGAYSIVDGAITLPFLNRGQYFRVFGSDFNDGVHKYGEDDLTDEASDGVIWKMRPPREFLALVDEITEWMDKYGDTMKNPYQSEDVIGVYRYTKMTSGKVTGDYIATWQNVFKDRLKEWRRLA
jgi:hypothetical protein